MDVVEVVIHIVNGEYEMRVVVIVGDQQYEQVLVRQQQPNGHRIRIH